MTVSTATELRSARVERLEKRIEKLEQLAEELLREAGRFTAPQLRVIEGDGSDG